MKLAPYFIYLTEVAKGAKYSKCPSIEIDENEKWKGPKCDTDYCHRRCKDGFTPGEPSKVFCFKKGNGTFKWIDETGANAVLGPCLGPADIATTLAPTTLPPTCKAIELKGSQIKSGMEVNCKNNSKGQTVCNLECPAGMTVNGKDGVIKKKLICKCGSKCKWKNEKNKKISKASYQKWKCEGTPDETTPEVTTTPEPEVDDNGCIEPDRTTHPTIDGFDARTDHIPGFDYPPLSETQSLGQDQPDLSRLRPSESSVDHISSMSTNMWK